MLAFFNRIHAKIGDFWWYSLLMFIALRCGDAINAFVGLWLVPKYVGQDELGAVLPLTQFAGSVGAPMTVVVTVFTKYLNKFKALGEEGKVKSLILWFLGLTFAVTIVSIGVSIVLLPHFFERIRITSGSLTILIIATGIIGTIAPVFNNALQGLKKFKTITVLNLIGAPIRLVSMLLLLPIRALSGYMAGQLVPTIVGIATSCFALRHDVRRSVKAVPFWRGNVREMLRYLALVAVWVGVGAVCSPINAMIVRQRLTDVESSAYYMISRFSELATFVGVTMVFVMFPLVSEKHENGDDSYKLLFQMSGATMAFGAVISAILYYFGGIVFEIIPTCRPYVSFVPDMALLAIMLTLNLVWTNYSQHELACNRFRFYIYGGPITIVQTAFLVCFTGYTFFNGILPESAVSWMGSLHIATLRNYIWTQLVFSLVRIVMMSIEILLSHFKMIGRRLGV